MSEWARIFFIVINNGVKEKASRLMSIAGNFLTIVEMALSISQSRIGNHFWSISTVSSCAVTHPMLILNVKRIFWLRVFHLRPCFIFADMPTRLSGISLHIITPLLRTTTCASIFSADLVAILTIFAFIFKILANKIIMLLSVSKSWYRSQRLASA